MERVRRSQRINPWYALAPSCLLKTTCNIKFKQKSFFFCVLTVFFYFFHKSLLSSLRCTEDCSKSWRVITYCESAVSLPSTLTRHPLWHSGKTVDTQNVRCMIENTNVAFWQSICCLGSDKGQIWCQIF